MLFFLLKRVQKNIVKMEKEPIMSKTIKTGCHGIVVTLTDPELHALTPNRYNGGSITSDLHEACPICERVECIREDCAGARDGGESLEEYDNRQRYNDMMDGIEAMILGHACAGIDITTLAYKEGIESAVQGCANSI